jgi:hypothetical protein
MGEAAYRQVIAQHSIDAEAAKLAQLFNAPAPLARGAPCADREPAQEA